MEGVGSHTHPSFFSACYATIFEFVSAWAVYGFVGEILYTNPAGLRTTLERVLLLSYAVLIFQYYVARSRSPMLEARRSWILL